MNETHAIWIEKYRPQNFDEVKGQAKIVDRVKAFVENKNVPHLLFAGPAGVGKTTLSLVIAKQLFGEDWKQNTLELNASDERGIDVIRTKVKDFARFRAIGNVPFKIIYLDECDALTKEAQQALRRTMENYAATTRFILSCNYISKIIDPIQSRCTVFKFQPLSETEIAEVLDKVITDEKLKITDEAKTAIFEISNGDCRRAENILQSCSVLSKDIDAELVFSLASVAKPEEVLKILNLAIENKFIESRNLLLDTMLRYGLSGLDIIKQMQKELWNVNLPEKTRVKLIDRCGDIEFRMSEGSDEYIQLEAFLAFIALQN
ncbi:MAG: replication factor C small subunit [Candidatus Woesearchaeota archaeon]